MLSILFRSIDDGRICFLQYFHRLTLRMPRKECCCCCSSSLSCVNTTPSNLDQPWWLISLLFNWSIFVFFSMYNHSFNISSDESLSTCYSWYEKKENKSIQYIRTGHWLTVIKVHCNDWSRLFVVSFEWHERTDQWTKIFFLVGLSVIKGEFYRILF